MNQLSALPGPELVFGLVGAVGSDLQAVTRTLTTYSPRQDRVDKLASIIAESKGETYADRYRAQAEELIQIDEQEENKLGQSVRDSYPRGDFFVDARSSERLQTNLARYVRLLFGHPFETPTRDEFAMFHAYAAALRALLLVDRRYGAW